MPIVDIKGVGKAEFPDDMTTEEIRKFLRLKYSDGELSRSLDQVLKGVSNPEYIRADARYGELGKINNKNGSISTEYSITENIPELGGWVNIPTLVEGQDDLAFLETGKLTSENVKKAISRAIKRKSEGAILPAYKSLEDAVSAAEGRTYNDKLKPWKG